jgi:type VI secretion system protein VasD
MTTVSVGFLTSGCSALDGLASLFSSAAKPSTAAITLTAAADINPDIDSRPSPVWVRVYQLRSVGVFQLADFEQLFTNDSTVLGAEILSRSEYVLTPKQSLSLVEPPIKILSDCQFIGVIAAYHEIAKATWRSYVEVSPLDHDYSLAVTLDHLAVSLSLEDA